MDALRLTNGQRFLIGGDILVLAITSVFGFTTHGTLGSAGMRILATLIPLLIAWFLIGPLMSVFNEKRVAEPRQLWRPLWAMVLAAPFAAFLRGVWLGQPIHPLFVVVIGGFSALALVAWRGLFLVFRMRLTTSHG